MTALTYNGVALGDIEIVTQPVTVTLADGTQLQWDADALDFEPSAQVMAIIDAWVAANAPPPPPPVTPMPPATPPSDAPRTVSSAPAPSTQDLLVSGANWIGQPSITTDGLSVAYHLPLAASTWSLLALITIPNGFGGTVQTQNIVWSFSDGSTAYGPNGSHAIAQGMCKVTGAIHYVDGHTVTFGPISVAATPYTP